MCHVVDELTGEVGCEVGAHDDAADVECSVVAGPVDRQMPAGSAQFFGESVDGRGVRGERHHRQIRSTAE